MAEVSINSNGVEQVSIAGTPTVNVGASALPTGASTSAKQDTQITSLQSIDGKLPALAAGTAIFGANAVPVRIAPNSIHRCGFADSGSGILTNDFSQISLGAGMGVSQSGGTLVQTSGTTANEEFLIRSTFWADTSWQLYFGQTQSQRIANHSAGFFMADSIGDGLAVTVNSATSITVAGVAGSWSSANVGQFMNISGIVGISGSIPGRYAIASVSGSDITFTVAGWPGSGSGTCYLWGWNFFKMQAVNTTTTNMAIQSQRKGWANTEAQVTIGTISSGNQMIISHDGMHTTYSETGTLTSSTSAYSARGGFARQIPDPNVQLYIWVWQLNGTTNPASSTTFTIDYVALEDIPANKVFLGGSAKHAVNYVTLSGTSNIQGPNAHDSASLAQPVIVGARGSNALTTAVAHNDSTTLIADLRGRLLVYGNNPREIVDKNIATVTNTTETTLIAAVASISHDITFLLLSNDGATAVRCDIRDSTGGTVRLSPVIAAGGNAVIPIGTQPLPQTTANNNWTIQASGSTTSLRVSAISVRS